MLEKSVLKELASAHNAQQPNALVATVSGLTDDDIFDSVSLLVRHLISGDANLSRKLVTDLRDKGMSDSSLYLDILAGAAKQLGEEWEQDSVTFVDVTLGLAELQRLCLLVQASSRSTASLPDNRRSIFLCCAENEQHTFGLTLLENFFERAGWSVFGGSDVELGPQALERLQNDWYSIVGISISDLRGSENVRSLVKELRASSLNQDVLVMMGGAAFADDTITASTFGADLTAQNAELAVEAAERLLEQSLS